jgi:hypothetical protein
VASSSTAHPWDRDRSGCPRTRWRQGALGTLANEKLLQLEHKIATISAMRDSLRRLVATCDRSPRNRECPLLEAIEDDIVIEGEAPVAEPYCCNDAAFLSSADGSMAIPHLIRLLARGEPVDLKELTHAAGQSGAELEPGGARTTGDGVG